MSGDLVPFAPRRSVYARPVDMLRDLAELDATLILTREADATDISYAVPADRKSRLDGILTALDGCGDTWTVHYLALIENMLMVDGSAVDLPVGTVRQLRLATAFVRPLPETGELAAQAVDALSEAITGLGNDNSPTPLRLSLVNQRADVLRAIFDAAGTPYQIDAAAEATRIAARKGAR